MPSPPQRPCGDGRSPSGTMPPAVLVPQSLGKGILVRMQTDKRCRCLGGLAVEVGAGGGTLQPMPAHPTSAGWA